MRFFLVSLFLLVYTIANAQNKVSLSGYIRDAKSSEDLLGATVYVKELGIGISANNYGFYSIAVPKGTYTLIFSYVGYNPLIKEFNLNSDQQFNAELVDKATLQEVLVSSKKKDINVSGTQMGSITLSTDKIKQLPVLFGEVDILKAIQLLPGVQSAGEGNAGFYVRGGGPDQNLILLDDAVVYNSGHLFGFFSVFNSDAIKSTTLIKGGMPAQYGGRLSSVVDISMKEGNRKEFHGEGGIGLIASRLTLEGPIVKDKGSFMISGRRTYIDAITAPFTKNSIASGSGYFFYDANLKANYTLGEKDRVYLSGYFGRDHFTFANKNASFKTDIPWGNSTATLRWNHLFNNHLFANATLVYNDYQFAFNATQSSFEVQLKSSIKDYSAKIDFDYYTNQLHHIKFGISAINHTFSPNQVSGRSDSVVFNPENTFIKKGNEYGLYISDEWEATRFLSINAGVRLSRFAQIGAYTNYRYDFNGNKADSTVYAPGETVQAYNGVEPRLNTRWQLNKSSSIKTSISRAYQYIHLLSNNGSTLPTDVWVPSTLRVKPQECWQYSIGYFKNLLDNKIETSVEVYYKSMKNQIEYRAGYTPNTLKDPELDYVFGKGEAYGAEFFINKTKGKFTGWIGYTLAWTYRTFPDLNNGEKYPNKYDRRHDISIVGTYELNKKWTFSSVFIYGSGNAITLPTNYYFIQGQLIQDYSKLNNYRIFPYHRLDLSAIYKPTPKKNRKWQGTWAFSIYNVYSRQNPYFLYLDTQGSVATGGITANVKQVSIFPILPSVTYNIKF